MTHLFDEAEGKREAAEAILSDLDLVARWQRFGRPVVVGAVAYGLVVEPDLDMEIYCPHLEIEHGFQVLTECARNPRVHSAKFVNELAGADAALYWQLRYRHADGQEWKVDMWSAPDDYALPRSESLVAPMKAALTPETRQAILHLKQQRTGDPSLACLSVDLYRAVLDDGVRTIDELRRWLGDHQAGELTDWKPQPST